MVIILQQGDVVGMLRLLFEQVIQIKQMFSEGEPVFIIAKKTGLSRWIVEGVDSKRYDFILEANLHGKQSN